MSEKAEKKQNALWENVKVIIQALLLAMVIRTVLFQPFTIPSGSMMPTLLVGDYLFVNKFSYGYSKYSLPFSPNLFSGRILEFSKPKRGDVVVFRLPPNPEVDYIKRLVGLPGDRIQVTNGCCSSMASRYPSSPTALSPPITVRIRVPMCRSSAKRWIMASPTTRSTSRPIRAATTRANSWCRKAIIS